MNCIPSIDCVDEFSYDSYPYACIVMLSHTDGMQGGETYIKRGDRTIEKVEGPSMGCAYLIQGGMLGKSVQSLPGCLRCLAACFKS
jgi:hypothetical protein